MGRSDLIAELAELSGESGGAFADRLKIGTGTDFAIAEMLAKYLPGYAAQAMRKRPDCFIVAEARHNAPVKDF